MNKFIWLTATLLLASSLAASAQNAADISKPRTVNNGKKCQIVAGQRASVVINGKKLQSGPCKLKNAQLSAETHGKNSPVVISTGNGSSVTINY